MKYARLSLLRMYSEIDAKPTAIATPGKPIHVIHMPGVEWIPSECLKATNAIAHEAAGIKVNRAIFK